MKYNFDYKLYARMHALTPLPLPHTYSLIDELIIKASKFVLFSAQITTSHKELEQLTRETGRTKTELQLLQETTEKRRQQLDSLDTQLEQEIASRRLEIKVGYFLTSTLTPSLHTREWFGWVLGKFPGTHSK